MSEQQANPLSTPEPWGAVADGYVETTMDVLGPYSDHALGYLGIGADHHIVDIAAGPGTLSLKAAAGGARVKALDFTPEMVAHHRRHAERAGHGRIEVREGDGQAMPWADGQFDAGFSMFGLMFFPDRPAGFGELHRVLKPGARALVASWAPLDMSPGMSILFGALQAAREEPPAPPQELVGLDNKDVFAAEMSEAGFSDVEIFPVTKSMDYPDLDQFWAAMVRGSVPIVMMKRNLDDAGWERAERIALDYLAEHLPDGPVSLDSTAYFGVGAKAG